MANFMEILWRFDLVYGDFMDIFYVVMEMKAVKWMTEITVRSARWGSCTKDQTAEPSWIQQHGVVG